MADGDQRSADGGGQPEGERDPGGEPRHAPKDAGDAGEGGKGKSGKNAGAQGKKEGGQGKNAGEREPLGADRLVQA